MKTDLVDMEAWQRVAPADDPFEPPPDAPHCDASAVRVEPFGAGGPPALDVDTSDGCGWATVAQPLRADLAPGDALVIRVFYFSQATFPSSEATVALRVGDELAWSARVPIPTSSDLVPRAPLDVEFSAPAGAPVMFHVGNHGDNAWSLLEVARVREGSCPDGAAQDDEA